MNVMRMNLTAFLGVFLLAVGAGCSGGSEETESGNPDLSGVWQRTSGELYAEFGTLGYLELRADGSGEIFSSAPSGILGCANLVYAALSGDVAQISIDRNTDDVFQFSVEGGTLTLTNIDGSSASFVKAASVPLTARCAPATESRRGILAEPPGGFTSLVSDGTNLFYLGQTGVVIPVDPATFATGTPITTLGNFENIVTMQGSDFWGHCGCGGSPEAQRTTAAGLMVDLVDTEIDLDNQISVRAGAFDGTRLWLAGNSRTGSRPMELLRINADVEPDVLESVTTLDFQPQALDFEAGQMWAVTRLIGSVLVALNPSTGTVSKTIKLPGGIYYEGLVVAGSNAFVVGTLENEQTGVIVVLAL